MTLDDCASSCTGLNGTYVACNSCYYYYDCRLDFILYNIYLYINIHNIELSVWLSWLRHQSHKQYDTSSSPVRTINIGIIIIFRSDLINCVYIKDRLSLKP